MPHFLFLQSGKPSKMEYPDVRKAVRFADLKAAGIINSWAALSYKIKHHGFPAGFKTGPQTRVWWLEDVEAWIKSRAVDPHAVNDTPALKKARAARASKRAEKAFTNA